MKVSRVYKTKKKTVKKTFSVDIVLSSKLDDLIEIWVNDSKGELYPLVMHAGGYDLNEDVSFAGIPSSVKTKNHREGEEIVVGATVTWKELLAREGFSYLDVDDNWGHKTYTLNESVLDPGSKATIVLPNDTEVSGIICFQPEVNSVSDWGRSYDVTSMVPHLKVDFQGNPMLVNIEDAQIQVPSHASKLVKRYG
jgi:hypothetical protein